MSSSLSPTEQLSRISSETNDDGTVNVTIQSWEKDGDVVTVKYVLPTGDVEKEEMDWPWSNDREKYKFIRVIERAGCSLETADRVPGREVTAVKVDGWKLHAPVEESSRIPFWLRLVFFPLMYTSILPAYMSGCIDDEHDTGYGEALLDMTIWVFVSGYLLILLFS